MLHFIILIIINSSQLNSNIFHHLLHWIIKHITLKIFHFYICLFFYFTLYIFFFKLNYKFYNLQFIF